MSKFLPAGDPEIKVIKCDVMQRLSTHETWDYAVHLQCTHPTHYVFIKRCECCGTWTEQVYVNGVGIEMQLTPDEVAQVQAGLE